MEAICFERLIDLLESYLDKSDEALCLSQFLSHNIKQLFFPSYNSYLGKLDDRILFFIIKFQTVILV
jgi:hypothetical protein